MSANFEKQIELESEQTAIDGFVGRILEERIELLSVIGRGASGVVYKAHHRLLDKVVAVKILNNTLFSSDIVADRFKREAQLLGAFDHEHIVKLHSFSSTDDGNFYMVLEYVQGCSLAEAIKNEGNFPVVRAIDLFVHICEAMDYAHSRGVIHRDIKPANVMLTKANEPGQESAMLLDFGICKAVANETQNLTRTGVLLGSSNYMSPEQCKSLELDQRSDIYSFACLMYETLVGQPPMLAENDMLTMSNQISKVISSVPAKNGIPKKLERIILRCLEKDKTARFASAADLAAELGSCKDLPNNFQKSKRTQVVFFAFACSFAVFGSILFMVIFWSKAKERQPSQRPSIAGDAKRAKENRKASMITHPEDVANDDDLKNSEKWLFAATNSKTDIKVSTVVGTFEKCSQYRASKNMDKSPSGDKVIAYLAGLFDEAQKGSFEKGTLSAKLALVYAWEGADSAALKALGYFDKRKTFEDWEEDLYITTMIKMLSAARLRKAFNAAFEDSLLSNFELFARKSGNLRASSQAHLSKAKVLTWRGNNEAGREYFRLAAHELCGYFKAPGVIENSEYFEFCEILAGQGETESLLELKEHNPQLDFSADDSSRMDERFAGVKESVARAYLEKGKYAQAKSILCPLWRLYLRHRPQSGKSDVAFGLLIQAMAKEPGSSMRNGSAALRGGSLTEAVKRPDPEGSVADEAILYLKEVGERAPERFETSKKLVLEQFRKYRIDASAAAQVQITK